MNTINYVKEHLWLNNRPLNYNPLNSPNTQDLKYHEINIWNKYNFKKKMISKKM